MSGLREYLAGGNDGPGGTSRWQLKPCRGCGGPKPPGRGRQYCDACAPTPPMCGACGEVRIYGRGKRYCAECTALRYEARQARKRARERLTRGKPCRTCGAPKPRGRRVVFCASCASKRSRARICERCERPARSKYAKLCADCWRVAEAKSRARASEWRQENLERLQAKDRARPSRAGRATREHRRMDYRLRREAQGLQLVPVGLPTAAGSQFPPLPSAPLAAAVERLIRMEEAGDYVRVGLNIKGEGGAPLKGHTAREAVCVRLGIDTRNQYAWSTGERPTIQFDVADRVLTHASWCWWDIWAPCAGNCGSCEQCTAAQRAQLGFEGSEAA